MKKALVSRYAAYGDIIHCSHIPRLLKDQGYDYVAFETNTKGMQLLACNPFIDKLIFFEPARCLAVYTSLTLMDRYWRELALEYDLFINLYQSLEFGCVAMEEMPEYYMHQKARDWMGKISFYDQTTKWAGFPELVGKYRGELWYTPKEREIVEKWMSKFKGKFVIMMNITGTTIHKILLDHQEYVDYVLKTYPDAEVILTGDDSCNEIIKEQKRVTNIAGKFPFRQAAHIVRYVDCMLTMESGMGVIASMWETPSIQLMTSSSLVNHPNDAKGDFSLQSPARCSPCSKGPYKFIGCPHQDGYPLCVYFDKEKVKAQIDKTYRAYKEGRFPVSDRPSFENANELSPLQDGAPITR
jgi:ADP-heptose:LPS heptosyltransferase